LATAYLALLSKLTAILKGCRRSIMLRDVDKSALSWQDWRSYLMRSPGVLLLAAVIVAIAVLLVVKANHSSPPPRVVVYDQNGHVVSSPMKLAYGHSTKTGKVVAVRCTHADGQVETATTPYEIKSLIHFCR
jgi:hypothetical protein